jgi:hypothetical protein
VESTREGGNRVGEEKEDDAIFREGQIYLVKGSDIYIV